MKIDFTPTELGVICKSLSKFVESANKNDPDMLVVVGVFAKLENAAVAIEAAVRPERVS